MMAACEDRGEIDPIVDMCHTAAPDIASDETDWERCGTD